MPNDLTTKRNLLDAREDLRLESRRKLASSGFTASTWTLSGVVLVACGGAGEITDALCPNFDAAVLVSCGGGSPPSGERHYVQSSPVEGARLYFDMNNDKVINDDDIATQNGQYPEGFVTDANGEVAPIPLHLYGKSFVAYLDGAINADTRESFPAGTKYYSITHPSDEDDMPASDEGDQDTLFLPFHNLASPITNWIAGQAELEGRVLTSRQVFEDVNNVIANFLGRESYSMLTEDELIAFDLLYAAILNDANYEGNPVIEALSAYLATNPSLTDVRSNAQTLIATLTDTDVTTLIVLHVDDDTTSANMIDLPDVTIGTNAEAGAYIATVYAVSAGAVSYRMVDENDVEVSGGNFVVDSRTGVISVADGADLTASNTAIPVYVQVTSGGESETVKIDVTVQSVATLTAPTTSGPIEIAENMLGSDAAPVVTGIDAGSGAVKANFIISDAADSPPGYAAMFDIVQDGTTWNLVLRDTESLDYEAIRGGEIKLNVQVDTATHAPSDVLEFTITVTDVTDITFSGDFGGEVTEDATDEDADSLVATGSISVNNNSDNADVSVTDSGTYGTLSFDSASGTWTYTLNNAHADVQSLRTGEFLVDTATISVASTPTATTKDIHVIIHGENEVLVFADATRTAEDVEIGDTALGGSFDLGNVLTDFGMTFTGQASGAGQHTTVEFADSVSPTLSTLFNLDPNGDLSFTGTSAGASSLGIGAIELTMIVSAPESTTEEIDPFTVQVNVALADQTIGINENDDSPANLPTLPTGNGAITYAITGGNDANRFTIDPTTGAITLNQNVHVNRATGTAEADIFVIDALTEIRAGAGDDLIAVNAGYVDVYGDAGNDIFYLDFATLVADVFNNAVTIKDYTNDVNQQDIIRVKVTTAQKAMIDAETSIADKFDVLGIDAYVGGGNFWFDEPISEESPLLIENISSTGDVIFEFVTEEDPALKGALDFESDATSYTLIVTATDTSNPADTDDATIIVNVENAQEGPADYEITLNNDETMLIAALVDADPNNEDPDGVDGAVMYRWFTIGGTGDSTTKNYLGAESTSNTLDISSHTLPVGATYGVEVRYLDGQGMNEEFDVRFASVYFFDHPQDAIMVNENDATPTVAPTNLPTVQAMSDAAIVSYRITDGNIGNVFDIGESTGEITLATGETLDYETDPNTYTLTILAEDANGSANSATVTINVIGVNDNAPDIVVANASPTVMEQTASADTDIITGITVTDADVGKTYAQGDFALTGDSKFKFVWDATAQTGSVVLTSGSTIAAGTISLSLTVTDANPVGHTGTDTQALTITVEAPPEDITMNSPPYTPDRQEQAHQDSYDPDDLGLTPMPDPAEPM